MYKSVVTDKENLLVDATDLFNSFPIIKCEHGIEGDCEDCVRENRHGEYGKEIAKGLID